MAASSKTDDELLIPRKSHSRNQKTGNGGLIINNSSDRSPGWIEPNSKMIHTPLIVPTRKVPVLYYLSRNGHLEHPHLIDVPLSSPHGLYLRDVMNTLNYHRGKAMANMYSWSYKRSYKNGYVWHDASDDDVIKPTNSNDYVIKGSEILQTHLSQNQFETCHTSDTCSSTATARPAEGMVVRRNQSWSSFDNPQEYLVVKCESNRELAAKFATNAAMQTEDQRRHEDHHVTMELSTDEIPSPPPSNSSSEVLDQAVSGLRYVDLRDRHGTSGRMKASQVLMQLITCGVDSVRNVNDPVKRKHDQGCMVSHAECSKSITSEAHEK